MGLLNTNLANIWPNRAFSAGLTAQFRFVDKHKVRLNREEPHPRICLADRPPACLCSQNGHAPDARRTDARLPYNRPVAELFPTLPLRTFQEVGRDLYHLALVTSHGGNLSVRDASAMWITGTNTMLGRLEQRHIARVLPDGSHTGPAPSTDTLLHAAIYALTGAGAVVHAHPRHAIALSFDTACFVPGDLEGQLHLKEVPVIEPGPSEIEALAAALQSHVVVLLRGHGAYARGGTLWEALHWITALEESAQIQLLRR